VTVADGDPDGDAIFWDGVVARRRPVTVRLAAAGVEIVENGVVVDRWAYGDLRQHDGGDTARFGCTSAEELARLEITDAGVAAALAARAPRLHPSDPKRGRQRLRIVVGSLAVAVSLVLTSLYLLPLAADRLVPFIPIAWEERLGGIADQQVKSLFGAETCTAPAGVAALDRLAARLAAAAGGSSEAGAPGAIRIAVLRSGVENAVTLPGGRIYLFDGLLRLSRDPDEVAGVLAHEIGHARARDGLRSLIRAGGTSYLLGLLFGDVSGSSAVVFAARLLVDSSHSREAERAADAESARIMAALDRPASPMAAFLLRVTGAKKGREISLLLSHPLSEERLAALKTIDRPASGPPLLDETEWAALKAICGQ